MSIEVKSNSDMKEKAAAAAAAAASRSTEDEDRLSYSQHFKCNERSSIQEEVAIRSVLAIFLIQPPGQSLLQQLS